MFEGSFRDKRVFVTGATGFKGTWLSLWLSELGAKVTGYSIDIPTKPSLFKSVSGAKRIRDVRGDILNLKALLQAMKRAKPDYVFHLAAQPLVRVSFKTPVETFATNALGTAHVLEAIRHVRSVKAVVVVTTDKVYAPSQLAHRESDPLGGDDPYSASKACAEIICQSYYQSYFRHGGPPLATVRAGNVVGGGDWAEYRIVPDMIRALQSKSPLTVRSVSAVRPWQHVLDPVMAYLLVMTKLVKQEIPSGQAFNIGPADESHVPVSRLVDLVKRQFPRLRFNVDATGKAAAGEALLLKLDWQKAAEQLGWHPLLSLEETVEWTCDWYKTYLENPRQIVDKTLQQLALYQQRAEAAPGMRRRVR